MTRGEHHFPSPVTTMITRRVRPGKEADYEQWLHDVAEVAMGFAGHQGVTVLRPERRDEASYTAIFTFDTAANLQRWMTSEERGSWLDRAESMTLDDGDVQTLTGLERWFSVPNRAVNRPPPRYKMAILTAVGVYPMLLLLSYVLQPLVGGWPLPLRLLASLSIGIPLMTWHIMPLLSRLFFPWLYPEPQRGPVIEGDGEAQAR
jgi:antibiotic biosynthesis monooxygenase (ABM) superfamily enzyme